MPKKKDLKEIEEDNGVIIVKNGLGATKVYEVIGKTEKGLYIGRDKNGLIECFSEYDIGKVKGVRVAVEEEGKGKYRQI